jgi:hypothetical protein
MKQLPSLWPSLLLLALSCAAVAGTSSSSLSYQPNSAGQLSGKIYYIRTDGADPQKCTGLVDAAYPGSGTNQACAWDHPFRALPPGGTPRIAGGDTLIIRAGSYRMGYGAPGAGSCDAGGSYDCIMPPIPSGPDALHPTRILGAGWNNGCAKPPQLWGAERPWFIINLTDSSNVELGCLEITDHSSCVEFHSGGLGCERDNPPYGNWAGYGLHAEDSVNVTLHDLNIHGLAAGGVHAGRLTDWTVERVRIAANGSVGWDGDLWDSYGDSNSGALTFRHLTVEWNGCGETYPGQQPTGCWAQSAGGYGDGFATGTSGGNWLIEDSLIRYNTSDGLDFLYISEPGSSVAIRRTLVEGNAGNQIKNYRGPFLLENSTIVGNCGYFDGKPFTFNVDNCRALGVALAIGLTRGGQATVTNNTITSEGDCLVTAECSSGNCNGTETVRLRNNIFQGQVDFLQPFEQTCLIYQETFPVDPFDEDYSLVNNVKDDACPGSNDICGVSPGLINTNIDWFNADLWATSPAIDAGADISCPTSDQRSVPRPQGPHCDIGALEYASHLTSRSIGASDGWILESSETSNTGGTLDGTAATFRDGDDAGNKQYRAILSFNTSSLPDNAVITNVTLKLKRQGVIGGGNPITTFQGFMVDIKKGTFGTSGLESTDWQASASITYGPFAPALTGGWYNINLFNAKTYVNKLATNSGLTQIRLRFKLGDNNNGLANYLNLYSGNAGTASSPRLIIEYYLP